MPGDIAIEIDPSYDGYRGETPADERQETAAYGFMYSLHNDLANNAS
jgi:hypothetical protein